MITYQIGKSRDNKVTKDDRAESLLLALSIETAVFWYVTPCGMTDIHRRFYPDFGGRNLFDIGTLLAD